MNIAKTLRQRTNPIRYRFLGRGHRRVFFKQMLLQIYFTFVMSIHIIVFLGFMIGLVISAQSHIGFSILGSKEGVGDIMVYTLFREVAPLAAILLIIARSVTAVASEVATMKVGSEIDALDILGIHTGRYIWAPRIVAGGISTFCSSFLFWIISLFGIWLGSNLNSHFPVSQVISSVSNTITIPDIAFYVIKTVCPGFLIFYIACKRGMAAGYSPHEVPIATNSAVVEALMFCFVCHFVLSTMFYLLVGF